MQKPLLNHQIRASKVRAIDEDGKQLGLIDLSEALKIAGEKGLDLIQVTEKVDPPVCRIMDYGKFLYHQKKKEKPLHNKGGEVKGIRLSFAISSHDLEVRAGQAVKFLKAGDKVRLEMKLRGREKSHFDFAKEKMESLVKMIANLAPIKVESPIKRMPGGLTMILSYDKDKHDNASKDKHDNASSSVKQGGSNADLPVKAG